MFLFVKSNVTPLNVFVTVGERDVEPVMYTLLPSLADTMIINFSGANEAGFLALFNVIIFDELDDADEYNDENTRISSWKLAIKLIVHKLLHTVAVLLVKKLEREYGPQVSNCNFIIDPCSIGTAG